MSIGVALSVLTGERRLLTIDEYFELMGVSEAGWELIGLKVDPETGEPSPEWLEAYGFTPGGPKVIPGERVEIEPGMFRMVDTQDDAEQ